MKFDLFSRFSGLLFILAILAHSVAYSDEVVLSDIEVRGLDRISAGTVFTYLPIDVGDTFDTRNSSKLIRDLYKSDFFEDIDIGLDGSVLVIKVVERPAIADISFDGNKAIETEQLSSALKSAGIAKGRVYNRSVVESLEQELEKQYFARGKYNVRIDTTTKALEGNMVEIDIDISEGKVAKIKKVNLIGNEAFTTKQLTKDFASGKPAWWSFLSSKDKYSRIKLSGDIEQLKSYYLDRGYLKFDISSSQVAITPDKKDIYITLNLDEGAQYTVGNINLQGELIFPKDEMLQLVKIEQDEIFARNKVINSVTALTNKLGDRGYAHAVVDIKPVLNEATHKVDLNFIVDPGNRVYVRRINFHGNYKTRDEVFRREMRQMEGGWYSTPLVKRSKVRIQRLPYIANVDIKTAAVPGKADQVDLEVTVAERLAGNFSASAGYSGGEGFIFSLGIEEENFLGTGNKMSLKFNNSKVNTVYSISYTNPYYTIDGVSRGFSAYYRKTDAGENSVADYLADRYGFSVDFGIPLSEYDFLKTSLGYENTEIRQTVNTPVEISNYIAANGNNYNEFLLNLRYAHDTRNRSIFAEKGNLQSLNIEIALPGSDLEYWKLNYKNKYLLPLTEYLIWSLRADIAYGDAYGDNTDLPFFEKYYAGGIRTLRGYESNSLGPRSSTNDPLGGNFRTLFTTELLFPPPFSKESREMRMGLFVDGGNVFPSIDDFESSELRYSAGVSFLWMSPVAPLTFSLARAFNTEDGDEEERFQFNLGIGF